MVNNPFVKHPKINLLAEDIRKNNFDSTDEYYHELSSQDKAHLFAYVIRYKKFSLLSDFFHVGMNFNYEFSDPYNFYCSLDPKNPDNFLSLATSRYHVNENLSFYKQMIAFDTNVSGAENASLFMAVKKGAMPLIHLYLEHGANPHARNGHLIIEAVKSGSLDILQFVHEELQVPLLVNGSDLRCACILGHLELVEYLIQHGANIHLQYEANESAICAASVFEHLHLVPYLVACGANPHELLHFTIKPFHYFSFHSTLSHPRGTCLEWAKNYIEKKPLHDTLKEELPSQQTSHQSKI